MIMDKGLIRDEFYRIYDEAVEQENFDRINSIPGISLSISSDKPCSRCYISDAEQCENCQQYHDWQNGD